MLSIPYGRHRLIPLIGLITVIVIVCIQFWIPYKHVYNTLVAYTHLPHVLPPPSRVPTGGLGVPPLIPSLLCSTWPGHFDVINLTEPKYGLTGGEADLSRPLS